MPASEGVTVTELVYTVTGLMPDTDYEYREAAENKAGQGPFSPPSVPMKHSRYT